MKLSSSYFLSEDTLFLSRDLLGKFLMTDLDGQGITGGMIGETEAYMAPEDKASHAFNHRRTDRTEVMFGPGGHAYIYLCYGMHHLFNIVTGKDDHPHAILIRALEPTDGVASMLKRRGQEQASPRLTAGPALLTKALGLTTRETGAPLTNETIWIEDRGVVIPESDIVASPRIGVGYAGDDADKPWRFSMRGHPSVSRIL